MILEYNTNSGQSFLDVSFTLYNSFDYLSELLVLNPLYNIDTIFIGNETIKYNDKSIIITKNIIKGKNLIEF